MSGVGETMKWNFPNGYVQEKWNVMRDVMLCGVAKSVLGKAGHREADWFKENDGELKLHS